MFRGKACHGGKESKVLVAANMHGYPHGYTLQENTRTPDALSKSKFSKR